MRPELRAEAAPSPDARPSALDVERRYRLSRHLQLQPDGAGFVAQSLITGHRERLPNLTAVRLLLSLTAPARLGDLLAPLDAARSAAVVAVLRRWLEARFITEVAASGEAAEESLDSLAHWEPHDLAFHLRSRRGRNPSPVGATRHLASVVPPEPLRRPPRRAVLATVPLPPADIDRLRDSDAPLTRVLERRRSRYSVEPLELRSLAELLYRACRVTGPGGVSPMDGEMIRKVHPSGGSLHSLETYVVANRCVGLPGGGYRYDPFDHRLERLRGLDDDVLQLLRDAQAATLKLRDLPSVLLIFASRFRRVTRKYQSLSYHVILQEVGALYQTIYLVGESLGLGVSAIGSGDSDRFASVFDTDFFAESSVGEMIVGGGASS